MGRHAMTREQALKALELHAGASFQEIKQAHRDLAVVWHPDRFARHDARLREKASERIKEINSAYDVLRSYDDGPSRPNEPRTKHTGTRQGASGTEQSETQRQRSRAKNRSTGSSADPPTSSERTGRDREAVIPARLPNTQNPETRETGLVVSGTGGRPLLAAASSAC